MRSLKLSTDKKVGLDDECCIFSDCWGWHFICVFQDIYKTKDLAITMPQATDLSKDIQETTGVITGKTVTAFDKKQLTLKIEASDYTITVILDKKRDVVRFDVTNRGQVDD